MGRGKRARRRRAVVVPLYDHLCDGWNDGGRANVVAIISEGECTQEGPDGGKITLSTDWSVNPQEDYEYGEHYWYSSKYVTLTDPLDDDSDDDEILDGPEFLYLWRNAENGPFNDSDTNLAYHNSCYDINQRDSDQDGLTDGEENWNHDDVMDRQLVGYYYGDADFMELLYKRQEKDFVSGSTAKDNTFWFQNDNLWPSETNWMVNEPWNERLEDGTTTFSIRWESKLKIHYNVAGNYTFDIVGSNDNRTIYINDSEITEGIVYYLDTGIHDLKVEYRGSDYRDAFIHIKWKFESESLEEIPLDNLTYYSEADPKNWDCDNDTLLDGAEPKWQSDTDFEPPAWSDFLINVWDTDSNNNKIYGDYIRQYVVFRTNATYNNETDTLDYGSGTWIAVDWDGYANLSNDDTELDLYIYDYIETTNPNPIPATTIEIYLNGVNQTVKTPNKQSIF